MQLSGTISEAAPQSPRDEYSTEMKALQIGIIGAGSVSQSIHAPGFRLLPDAEIALVCDPNRDAAAALGAPVTQNQDELLSSNIDAVIIATPNHLHRDIALAAIAAGKHVLCEKPLALTRSDADEMAHAAAAAGVVHMTAFTYRYTPAIQYLRHLVAEGTLGDIRTIRAAYLMALSKHLLGWRSTRREAGSGVLADIGSHLVHLVQFVAGDIAAVTASKRRFRDDPASDVEDWISFLAEFSNGACGTFEISRVCAGRGAGISEDIFIDVYGTRGSALFSLQNPLSLRAVYGPDADDPSCAFRNVPVPSRFLKLPGSPRNPEAHDPRWGYRYDQAFQFVDSARRGEARAPSFADGARCQAVLDAALASCETRRWVNL